MQTERDKKRKGEEKKGYNKRESYRGREMDCRLSGNETR